jgi:hypothetical protein
MAILCAFGSYIDPYKDLLTLRRLMSYIYIYIYGARILDVSRSHTNDAAQSVGLLWTSDQLVAETST